MRTLKSIVTGVSLLALILAAAAAASAQEERRSESRAVSGFTGVDIGGAMDATIEVGGGYEVRIEARADVLSKIVTEVRNGVLVVKHDKSLMEKSGLGKKRGKVNVYVSLPSLEDLDISGASNAKVSGVNSDSIRIDISGASDVTIGGYVRTADIDISGASDLEAIGLTTDTAEIDASGASSVKLSVTSSIRADASGASSVCYAGSPTVQIDTSGASSVKGGCGVAQ